MLPRDSSTRATNLKDFCEELMQLIEKEIFLKKIYGIHEAKTILAEARYTVTLRIIMHVCLASTTTATPCGLIAHSIASALCDVRRSCTRIHGGTPQP
jgi:hypothetical protein